MMAPDATARGGNALSVYADVADLPRVELVCGMEMSAPGPIAGVAGTSVLLPPLLLALIWTAHHRSTVGRFRRMPTPVADITFRDDGLGIASELGSGHLSWSSMTEIWERPGYWMIFSGPNQVTTLPVEAISGDDLELLRSKVSRPHSHKFGFDASQKSAVLMQKSGVWQICLSATVSAMPSSQCCKSTAAHLRRRHHGMVGPERSCASTEGTIWLAVVLYRDVRWWPFSDVQQFEIDVWS